MTREEIIEIEQYCMEHGVGKKARLAELGIPFWSFYRTRRRYQMEDERSATEMSAGNFVQLSSLPLGPAMQPSKRTSRKTSQKDAEPIVESYLTVELRTASGTAMRIQGNMTRYSGAMSASNSSLKKVKMMLDHL